MDLQNVPTVHRSINTHIIHYHVDVPLPNGEGSMESHGGPPPTLFSAHAASGAGGVPRQSGLLTSPSLRHLRRR